MTNKYKKIVQHYKTPKNCKLKHQRNSTVPLLEPSPSETVEQLVPLFTAGRNF